ncbi:MAG: type IV pilus secretin PilQ [Betaproteobacteria bacterium]|nr:type IV pilus secretin PilQ [Betaproteobacteria bacterium]
MFAYAAVLAATVFSATSFAQAQANLLQSINTSTLQGGKVIIRANFKDALTAAPPGFTVTNPARIAIDLPGVSNALGKNTVDIGEGDVRSVSVVEVSGRTRLVINLTRSLNYTTALDANSLVVTLEGVPLSAVKETAQVTKFAEASTTLGVQKQSLRDIDFRRGGNGEGRVIVDLSSANTGIDIRQQGKSILVDFINTSVPRNLVRRLDVIDFATPVRTVDVLDQGANTRMIIEPKGLWEYSAYQTDTQFIIEVKQLKDDPNKMVPGVIGYGGEKLSLNFQNVEVRAVLQVIADFTGLNIVTSDTVGGSLTLRLKDVPWDQALDIILQAKGLNKRKNGNVVLIAPADELATKEKLALEASQQISELEPLRTESFQLSYTKADDVKRLVSDKDQRILSKRGSSTSDPRTNTLFVNDTLTKLDEVRRLIAQLDVPVRQVLIEARIVIADDKWGSQLGAKFNLAAGANRQGRNIGVAGNIDNAHNIVAGTTPLGADTPIAVNLPVLGAAGSLGINILNIANNNLIELELSALESDGRGKVVSNPRIVAPDKKKAIITQGTEIPYETQSASGGTTIQFKPAVLSLEVTPQITPDDKVIMDLEIKKDSVGQIFRNIPSIDTKTVRTSVLVDNGDTAVLGGIFETVTRTDVTKVPLLGDIPVVGTFFKRTIKQQDKTELLIFITPRIIKEALTVR